MLENERFRRHINSNSMHLIVPSIHLVARKRLATRYPWYILCETMFWRPPAVKGGGGNLKTYSRYMRGSCNERLNTVEETSMWTRKIMQNFPWTRLSSHLLTREGIGTRRESLKWCTFFKFNESKHYLDSSLEFFSFQNFDEENSHVDSVVVVDAIQCSPWKWRKRQWKHQ